MKRVKMTWLISSALAVAVLLPAGCRKNESGDRTADDGNTVQVEDGFDERGWKGRITVVVEGNDIVTVDYDEVNRSGELKSRDREYIDRMKPESGIGPDEAMRLLEMSLVETDDPGKVDVVSGATATSRRFIELAGQALAERGP